MILELADIRIHSGQNQAFDEAIARGLREVISHAKGFQGFKVNKGIENPERYMPAMQRLLNRFVPSPASAWTEASLWLNSIQHGSQPERIQNNAN